MEEYRGVKFRVVFLRRESPNDKRTGELSYWCRRFHELGLTPVRGGRSEGNLSFRLRGDTFVITASGLGPKDSLEPDCFVKVVGCDLERRVVYASGLREPSSESMLHSKIYELRSDVGAVFHGHDQVIVSREELGLVQTRRWCPYGSVELVRSVEEVLGQANFIVMRGHGFLSLGRSMKEAGELAVEKRKLLRVEEV